MKKQAVNTFSKGLAMDFSPLLTPNNVLTNNLNGTLITFNGNEYVLQNDLGNGEVGTAKLPSGYVPVGMKEHGGIIYVASHNPLTGKNQIGSFPSPQQLYNGEDANIASVNLDFSNLIALTSDSVPVIKYENYKERLFQETNSVNYKTFHPGDRFIITTGTISPAILQAISDGVLTLKLGVITSSGAIEYMDDSKLRTYPITYNNETLNLWIYQNTGDITSILKDPTKVQVFSSKSSGWLVLIVELHVIDTFDLSRTYSQDANNNSISVSFNGSTTSAITKYSGSMSDNMQLYSPNIISNLPHIAPTITLTGQPTDTVVKNYEISPACPYGVIDRMKKVGSINFSEIRPNSQKFSEWRFFVNTDDNYLKINWGYDYYNMSEDQAISKMKFLFYDLADVHNDFMTATTDAQEAQVEQGGPYVYEVTRKYFNGNFEEIIPFSASTISKNKVYVIVIRKCIAGVWSNVTYRFLYTSTYYNSFFDGTVDFTQLSPNVLVNVTPTLTNTVSKSSTAYNTKLASATDYSGYSSSISASQFIKQVNQDTNVDNYTYSTKVKRTYNVSSKITLTNDFDNVKFVGTLDTATVNDKYSNLSTSINSNAFSYSKLGTSDTSSLADTLKDTSRIDSAGSMNFSNLTGTGTLSTSREIYAQSGGVNALPTHMERLLPLYRRDMSNPDRQSLYNFRADGTTLYCCTGDRDYISYNSKILKGEAHTTGDFKGENAGAGAGDTGLQAAMLNMGKGCVGILAGHDKDDASYKMYGVDRILSGSSSNVWNCSKGEVDGEDDFLLAAWKNPDGKYSLINFGSRKTEEINPDTSSSTNGILRLDRMLNCILSQILSVQNVATTVYFVGPSSSAYVYHTQFDTDCNLTIHNSNGGKITNSNIYYNGNKTIQTLVNEWQTICGSSNLINYLPSIDIYIPEDTTTTISFGSDIRIDDSKTNLLDYYLSAYSRSDLQSVLPASVLGITNYRQKLYVADPTYCTGHDPDGSLLISSDDRGNTVPLIVNGSIVDNKLALWDYSPSNRKTASLPYNLNTVFTTQYEADGKTGKLDTSYFNGMLLRREYSPDESSQTFYNHYCKGKWTNSTDHSAPHFCFGVSFWTDTVSTNIYRHPYALVLQD